jgi:hypothetical protein
VLVDRLLHVEGLEPLLAVFADRVEVALHHVVLVIDRRERLGRLHIDEPVHAVRHVHADRRGGAVVDVEAGVQRLEAELRLAPGRRERAGRAAAGAGDRVEVDVVRHLARRVVREVKLDEVALAHADEFAGHLPAEGPEHVFYTGRDLHLDLFHLEVHHDLGRLLPARGGRDVGRVGEDRLDGRALGRAEVRGGRGGRGGRGVCDDVGLLLVAARSERGGNRGRHEGEGQ